MVDTLNYIMRNMQSFLRRGDKTPSSHRSRQLKLSVITSIFSKGVSIILQLVLIPLAISALGTARFGVYVTITATLGWINMAGIGIGPGLTLQTTVAAASDDRIQEQRLFSTAFFLIVVVTIITLSILFIMVSFIGIPTLFGPRLIEFELEIRQGLVVLGLLLGANLLLSVAEATQLGHQNQHVNNSWLILGNVLTIGSLYFFVLKNPSIVAMILAVYGSITFAKILNGVSLIRKRPYLFPQFRLVSLSTVKLLLGVGLAFLVGQFATLLYQQFSVFLVGRQLGPQDAATFAVMMQIITLVGSFVVMVTVPLWPAITDGVARNDIEWVNQSYRKTLKILMPYAFTVGTVIVVGGKRIIHLWIGPEIVPSTTLLLLFGLLFILIVWDNVHYMVLIGLGQIRFASLGSLIGAGVMILVSIFAIADLGTVGIATGLCLGRALVTTWLFPYMTSVRMAKLRSATIQSVEGLV